MAPPPSPTTCADIGMLGSPYPSGCYSAPLPPPATTCADIGMLGSPYPSGCYAPPPPPPGTCTSPTVSITANPNRVKVGQRTTLKVIGTGLTSACTVTGTGVNQTVMPSSCNASAVIPTPALTKQTTYTITCPDIAGSTTVIVNLNPVFTPF